MLRQWFPKMPIQALSATCPPRVQDDIIKILKLMSKDMAVAIDVASSLLGRRDYLLLTPN